MNFRITERASRRPPAGTPLEVPNPLRRWIHTRTTPCLPLLAFDPRCRAGVTYAPIGTAP